jgi:uroporphyrinogen-III synthase
VHQVIAYRTVQLRPAAEIADDAMSADVLFLASGSAASAWFDAFGTRTPPIVVAIGPSTAKVASNLGLDVTAVAPDQSLESMIETAERVIESHQH